ncbi:uroporphyrin-III C-methyltransferase [Micromonospora nigra]|uniref:uroporphyrinogen-III C-methyltransferase n=1 Tax=Micromonospora nigra TaxID=145857 RepID=A0A1C6T0L5_9ACTN|nr:uroporphyrinogen-III C-methyltransferase [Micromonospora nigra]SCL35209.1 uroporphyrin-III C-methyltransferase [Micromonospora nigra]
MTGLVIVGHGTRSEAGVAQFAALVDRVRRRAAGDVADVAGGFIELSRPPLTDAVTELVDRGHRALVALPLVLTAAGHGKGDIPAAMAREQRRHPGLTYRYGRPLGPHPLLHTVLEERIDAALAGAGRADTWVALIGRGSTDPDANAEVAKVARLLWEGRGYAGVEPGFVSLAEPSVPAVLERLRRLGARRIVVAPYFLFAGVLPDRIVARTGEFAAAHPDLDVRVADLIGDCDALADLVLQRHAEALGGDIRMNCDTCAYRVLMPGFADKVGRPQTPHDHPDDPVGGHHHGHGHHLHDGHGRGRDHGHDHGHDGHGHGHGHDGHGHGHGHDGHGHGHGHDGHGHGPALAPGQVAVVGGGPGPDDLITVRGRALVDAADVVVVDRLAPQGLLTGLRPDVLVVDAAKVPRGPAVGQDTINATLVAHARAGRRVVRLKGGDPYVFGRGHEEVQACLAAGVPVTVVPGVTSAVAAAELAGVPVTHRGVAHDLTVVSGHLPPGHPDSLVDWPALGRGRGTLVLLMAVDTIAKIATALVEHGRAPDTPVLVVQDAGHPGQRVESTRLDEVGALAVREGVAAPAVFVVGEVVRLRAAVD